MVEYVQGIIPDDPLKPSLEKYAKLFIQEVDELGETLELPTTET
jgi:hypothetical protein